jgi:formate--tetrahydrofolate ligase
MLEVENLEMIQKGFCNLKRHIENMKKYNLPIVVCLNKFASDSKAEINLVKRNCENLKVDFEI